MSKKRFTRWYLYPHNPAINRKIADAAEGSFYFNGDLYVEWVDGRKNAVPLWEVHRHIVTALENDPASEGKFTVFVQENNGRIREFNPKAARRRAVSARS